VPTLRPRRPSRDRVDDLVAAAATVFGQYGYRRTQMADIAHRAGVSPGNLYNYVDSKDALFYLVLRRMFGEGSHDRPLDLPLTGATVEVTADWVEERLDFVSDFPELEGALARRRPRDASAEIEAVIGELYDVLARMRVGIDMIERSADDVPELARVFGALQTELFARYERYLRARQRGSRVSDADPATVAHLVVELCWWAAGRRHHDPHATDISDSAARQAACSFVAAALSPR
jgi:AcrR family transcriptional regulator